MLGASATTVPELGRFGHCAYAITDIDNPRASAPLYLDLQLIFSTPGQSLVAAWASATHNHDRFAQGRAIPRPTSESPFRWTAVRCSWRRGTVTPDPLA